MRVVQGIFMLKQNKMNKHNYNHEIFSTWKKKCNRKNLFGSMFNA